MLASIVTLKTIGLRINSHLLMISSVVIVSFAVIAVVEINLLTHSKFFKEYLKII